MSALIGSEGENHLQDRQFSDCHEILFKLLVSSVILITDLSSELNTYYSSKTQLKVLQTSHLEFLQLYEGKK
jgi:hypothetical protein